MVIACSLFVSCFILLIISSWMYENRTNELNGELEKMRELIGKEITLLDSLIEKKELDAQIL